MFCNTRAAFVGTILLTSAFTVSLAAQDRYAILVGVETYDRALFNQLEFAEEDAVELGKALEQIGFNTLVMTGTADSPRLKPSTPGKILKLIEARCNTLADGDTIIVSLSGHGVQFADDPLPESGTRETWFCPEDASLHDRSTLLPISRVIELLDACGASRKLLILDACRNEVISEKARTKGDSNLLGTFHETERNIPGGLSVLFSCSSRQFSWEHTDLGHSVFTSFIIDYLRGGAEQNLYENGLNLDALVYHVRRNTNDFVLDHGLTSDGQHPILMGAAANWQFAAIAPLESYRDVPLETIRLHATYGFTAAQHALGRCYHTGAGIARDFGQAIKWYRQAAEAGSGTAMNNLGLLYSEGLGVEVDTAEAMEWFRRAAEKGVPHAVYNLGNMYRSGNGVPEDHGKAFEYFLEAAADGHSPAQNVVGHYYSEGISVEQDPQEAVRWFRMAAEQHHPEAQFNLGQAFHYGQGAPRDLDEARKWYRKAAENGIEQARVALQTLSR